MALGTNNLIMVVDKLPGVAQVKLPEGAGDIKDGIWIKSTSVTCGQVGAADPGGGSQPSQRRSQVRISTIDIEKPVDEVTTSLFNALTTARAFATWDIHVLRPTGDGKLNKILTWSLAAARVREQSLVTVDGAGGAVTPMERLKIAFSKISLVYYSENWTPGSARGEFNSAMWNVDNHVAE